MKIHTIKQNKFMKTNKIIGSIILAGLIIGGAIFFSKDVNKDDYSSEVAQIFQDEFLKGCIGEDLENIKMCNCTYDKIEKEYSTSELFDVSLKFDETGELPNKMKEIALSCM